MRLSLGLLLHAGLLGLPHPILRIVANLLRAELRGGGGNGTLTASQPAPGRILSAQTEGQGKRNSNRSNNGSEKLIDERGSDLTITTLS